MRHDVFTPRFFPVQPLEVIANADEPVRRTANLPERFRPKFASLKFVDAWEPGASVPKR
jgi:hypothetical protein